GNGHQNPIAQPGTACQIEFRLIQPMFTTTAVVLTIAIASRPLQPIRKDLVIRFRRQRLAREAIMAAKEISVKKYVVRLSGEERELLETLIRKGKSPARRVLKARILLKADVSEAGKGWSDNRIIEALETSPSMVYRVRKQLVEEGFEAVLSRKPRATP